MLDQQVWGRVGKIFNSVPLRPEEQAFLLNASQGIELPYTVTISKQKQTRLKKENLSLLLSKIGPSPW